MKFARWTVISRIENSTHLKFPRKCWLCKCDCGTERIITETNLINNKTQSCGCSKQYKGIERENHTNIYIHFDDYVIGKLIDGKEFIIDKEDYKLIKDDYWIFSSDGYAVSSSGKFKRKRLHRIVMNYNGKQPIDHINRNKLDCRKANLRVVTNHENSFNQSKRRNNNSGIIGVCWWSRDNNWMAQIKFNYKRYFLGYYNNFDDAIKARLQAELKYFGKDFAPQRHLFKQYGIGVENNAELSSS